ncbi:MAG TPA: hypothetical protein VFV93_15215 [Thermomicrobiales bacterium]|nr:hypothetical protein [Thermomicrobiales bacterium]
MPAFRAIRDDLVADGQTAWMMAARLWDELTMDCLAAEFDAATD